MKTLMMMEKFKKGEKLSFNIYATLVKGYFVEMEEDIIKVTVLTDSSGVNEPGDIAEIHKSFLEED